MRKHRYYRGMKNNDNNYTQIVINKMTEIVEKKLDNMKAVFPIILTIVTSLLVYLFTTNFPQDALWMGYIIIAYLLLAFCSILMAWYPRNCYQEHKSFLDNSSKTKTWIKKQLKEMKLIQEFSPWNVKSYLKLTNEEFICEMEKFCQVKFRKLEELEANILKQKINELYYKKQLLFASCAIIIGGALILAILFTILFFMGSIKL